MNCGSLFLQARFPAPSLIWLQDKHLLLSYPNPFLPQVIVFEEKMAGPMIQFTETPHLGRNRYLN